MRASFCRRRLFNELLFIDQTHRGRSRLAEIGDLRILRLQDQPITEVDAIIGPDELRVFFHNVQHTHPHYNRRRSSTHYQGSVQELLAFATFQKRPLLNKFFITGFRVQHGC